VSGGRKNLGRMGQVRYAAKKKGEKSEWGNVFQLSRKIKEEKQQGREELGVEAQKSPKVGDRMPVSEGKERLAVIEERKKWPCSPADWTHPTGGRNISRQVWSFLDRDSRKTKEDERII